MPAQENKIGAMWRKLKSNSTNPPFFTGHIELSDAQRTALANGDKLKIVMYQNGYYEELGNKPFFQIYKDVYSDEHRKEQM